MAKDRYVAYVGTYTHGSSVGIHIFDVDAEKGKMIERKVVPINNPSDVIVSTSGKFLYSIADEGVEAFKVLKDHIEITDLNNLSKNHYFYQLMEYYVILLIIIQYFLIGYLSKN